METTVKTNHRTRSLFYAHEYRGDAAALRKEFDWMDDREYECAMFFKYRGEVYALAEFIRCDDVATNGGWQGYLNEHAWSSLVVKIRESHTSVIVGRMICS